MEEIATMLGIGLAHAYEVVRQEGFPSITLGERIVIPRDHFLQWMESEVDKLAPSTMMTAPGKRVKTDRKDAERISKCLAFHTYSPVHIPTEMDDAVKKYIRMRDDGNKALIRIKQQIIAFWKALSPSTQGVW